VPEIGAQCLATLLSIVLRRLPGNRGRRGAHRSIDTDRTGHRRWKTLFEQQPISPLDLQQTMAGKSNDKFYKTVVFAEDMTDAMLEKALSTARDAFQLQVTVRATSATATGSAARLPP
jgi:hypothetical protein